jgi:hypothetical protein
MRKSKQQEVLSPQGKAVDLSMALLIKDNSLESGKPNLLALIKLNWPAIAFFITCALRQLTLVEPSIRLAAGCFYQIVLILYRLILSFLVTIINISVIH